MRFVMPIFAGLVAMWGAHDLGIEWRVAWSLLAVPVTFAIVNVLSGQVNSLVLTFGIFALLWVHTPLQEAVLPLLKRATTEIQQPAARPSH